jgi:replication factor C subunit 1
VRAGTAQIARLFKMNLSVLRQKPVSVCGIEDSDAVSSFLTLYGVRVLPMCERIGCLIVGSGASGKWKCDEARRLGLPTISESELLALKPDPVASDLWVDKYKPAALKHVIGNAEAIKTLRAWLADWASATGSRGALVSGPPGIGKTTAVHLVCAAAGYDVVEFNASDARSASAIRAIFEDAARSGCVGKQRVIVMDEVDGMSAGDRGGVGALAAMIRDCAFPVICIANERGGPRLRPLENVCLDVRFARPDKRTIAKALGAVCEAEGIRMKPADLEMLCERNGNDIRQILNFLQFSSGGARRAGAKDELQRVDAFSAAGRLFGYHAADGAPPKYGSIDSRINLIFVDHGMVPLMIGEAYAAAAGRGGGSALDKLAAMSAAAEAMSSWDLLDRKIHREQQWGLLPAAAVSVVRAAAAARGPAPFRIFPSLLGKMSKRAKMRRLQSELGARLGTRSATEIMDMRPLLRARLFSARDATVICDTLDGFRMTRDDMFETLTETVFTGDEDTVAMDAKLKAAVTREMGRRSVKDTLRGAVVAEEEDEVIDADDDDDELHLELI